MDIRVPIDVNSFIDREIARSVRGKIVPLVQQAYRLVDAAIEEVSFLQWDIGKKHIGYLDNIAVQFSLYEAAKQGKLNEISAKILPNAIKSAYHVELNTDNVIITINRAKNKEATSRKAIYRSILQRDNQFYWSFDKQNIFEEPGYLELTHNHKNRIVDFVNLGIPNGIGKWFSCIDLTKELHLVGTSDKDKENNDISREQLVKFKKFAQGVQEDGGKK
jgi:hypothetical protein